MFNIYFSIISPDRVGVGGKHRQTFYKTQNSPLSAKYIHLNFLDFPIYLYYVGISKLKKSSFLFIV